MKWERKALSPGIPGKPNVTSRREGMSNCPTLSGKSTQTFSLQSDTEVELEPGGGQREDKGRVNRG